MGAWVKFVALHEEFSTSNRIPSLSRISGISAINAWRGYLADPLRQSELFVKKYGPFLQVGPVLSRSERPAYHVACPLLTKEIFSQQKLFRTGGMLVKGNKNSVLNAIRTSYFAANGAEHTHYQRKFKIFFQKKAMISSLPAIEKVVSEEVSRWPFCETSDVEPLCQRLTMRLASATFFNDPDRAQDLAAKAAIETTRLGRIAAMNWRNLTPLPIPGSTYTASLKQAERASKVLLEWAETRRGLAPDRDILSSIVNGEDENGAAPSPGRIAAYAWNMFGASYDTTTSILTWALVLLTQHPSIASRLREEFCEVGWQPGGDPTAVLDAPLLDATMRESLRLFPAAPFQRRKPMATTTLGGVEITRNSSVIVSAWALQRNPDLYPEPKRFLPDRWLSMSRTPFEWLAFSAGPRRCTGIWFAEAFIKLSLAHIVATRSLAIPKDTRIDARVMPTLRPVPSVPISFDRPSANVEPFSLSGDVTRMVDFPRSC